MPEICWLLQRLGCAWALLKLPFNAHGVDGSQFASAKVIVLSAKVKLVVVNLQQGKEQAVGGQSIVQAKAGKAAKCHASKRVKKLKRGKGLSKNKKRKVEKEKTERREKERNKEKKAGRKMEALLREAGY